MDSQESFRVEMTLLEQKGMTICHPGDGTRVPGTKRLDLARNQAGMYQNTLWSMPGCVGVQSEVKSSWRHMKMRRFASILM